jgi:succinoglycan biosynthesis transport protein ExoP
VQQDSEGLNLERTLRALRRRSPLILLCVVLAAGAAYGFSKRQTEKYTATASLVFSNNPLSQQIAGLSPSGSSSSSVLAQEDDNLELVKGGDMASKTASLLGRGLTAQKVADDLSIAGAGESGVIDVTATATSPAIAAAIANTYTSQFLKEQQSANHQYFESALALVNKQLMAIPPRQRFSAAATALQNRAQTLRLLNELKYGNVQVAQEALPPTSPSLPKTSRNTLIGGVLGLLIGLGLAFLLERLDRRIKGPEDLEAIYRLPMLGVVPESAALARSGGQDGVALPPAEAEAFSLIRAHLRFFNVDRDVRTVVIASPTQGDGKSTIARHLAEAAARSGSRVLLLEVDLRHPTLAQQLGIQPGPGLADVLIGVVSMDEATQPVAVRVPPGEGAEGRTLDVLAAGAILPPNPAELLESRAMGVVLERVKSVYNLVVIDTPPLTAVSDAFPLLTKVDGVVVVGRVGHSRRDAAERLQRVLAGSGAPLLGVIASGSNTGAPTPYYRGGGKSSPTMVAANGASPSEQLAPTTKA